MTTTQTATTATLTAPERAVTGDAYVEVRVCGEDYALPVEQVLEVSPLGSPTLLPGAPPELLGLCNVRGCVLPVYHLGALLGAAMQGPASRLVVVAHGTRRAGFAADEVTAVGPLPPADAVDAPLLLGSVLHADRLVGIVDVEALFADADRRFRP